jgi:hypothetical protein
VDAIGQTMGGPAVGLVANLFSVRLAVSISSLLLSPALVFIQRANRIHPPNAEVQDRLSEPVA